MVPDHKASEITSCFILWANTTALSLYFQQCFLNKIGYVTLNIIMNGELERICNYNMPEDNIAGTEENLNQIRILGIWAQP
jgi:hypothetical protein